MAALRELSKRRLEKLEDRTLLHASSFVDDEVSEGEPYEIVPDFSLVDVNPTSATFNQSISPRDFEQGVSAWYFGRSTWGYCSSQFGYLDQIQQDIEDDFPALDIQIIGMNEVGHESANSSMSDGRDLPLLQDVDGNADGQSDHWLGSWDVLYRDVVLVDSSNTWISSYNLTDNDLSQPANYAELRDMLVDLAIADNGESSWHNYNSALDVNNDSSISARDALLVINEINLAGSRKLATLPPGEQPEFYIDTTEDRFVSARDALLVINQLKVQGSTSANAVAAVAETPQPEYHSALEIDASLKTALQDAYDDDDHLVKIFAG